MPGTPCHVAPAHEVKEITLLGFQVSPGKPNSEMRNSRWLDKWCPSLGVLEGNTVIKAGSPEILSPETWFSADSEFFFSNFFNFKDQRIWRYEILWGHSNCNCRHGSPFPFSWPAGKSYMHTWIGKSCPHAALWGCCQTTSCETGVIKRICPLMMSCVSLLKTRWNCGILKLCRVLQG